MNKRFGLRLIETAIYGKTVDDQSRCVHWHLPKDVIAIRFKCCDKYYACFECHQELSSHPLEKYDLLDDANKHLIICGVCRHEMTFAEYYDYNSNLICPNCRSPFNPGCKLHYHLYFQNPPPAMC
ncbi:BFH_collapsed_G0032900.mRNA.1.CDS.1 [Saccharomyces cerevisiae]|nr:BFH_HP2_G0032300.mRNA.1.CDS.1 [Saccharomyces cerevisiae]CAI6615017.1 BFH_HP2_G0032300.mRNA.1.CDS.1 [Saccharomyces cerevisiae]CAI6624194.1 BFH_HP1_G0032340.mRNA.1.CDS.1 [Saccharomyces cerevisiae]CAI7205592.1 BFH_collapsed_G0032900.mRNA.1.CDS.1 [Saccharomyces cerevisiae]